MEKLKEFKTNLEERMESASNIVIVPHEVIDFDAIASSIGIALFAKRMKKNCSIIVNDPSYRMDHGVQLIINEAKKELSIVNYEKYLQTKDENDLFIFMDVNKKKLVCLKEELDNKNNNVIIDHHDVDDNTIDSSLSYIDPTASSTSEIVTKLLGLSKMKYSPEVANCLLAGIYLDTNKLTKNVTPEIMKVVTRLLENGANMNVVTEWFSEDFNSERRVYELLSRAQIITYSIGVIIAEEGNEYTREELAKAADKLLTFKLDSAYAIGEIDENVISISARSKENVDVGKIMQELGGGGNQYSAATKIENSTVEEVGKKLIKTIQPPYYLK